MRSYQNTSELPKKLITRKEAKLKGLTRYFTGKPCKHGHIDFRAVNGGNCYACARQLSSRYRKNNPETIKEKWDRWYSENKEYAKDKSKNHYRKNSQVYAQYRENNKKVCSNRQRKSKLKNRSYYTAKENERRARKLQATPAWLSQDHLWVMKEVYSLSSLRSKLTGVEHHVDHIVPLKGKEVSGLHVPWNLQVITATENQMKNNKLDQLLAVGG